MQEREIREKQLTVLKESYKESYEDMNNDILLAFLTDLFDIASGADQLEIVTSPIFKEFRSVRKELRERMIEK